MPPWGGSPGATRPASQALCISNRSRPKRSSDAGRDLYDAGGMDEKAIRRAALLTLRRAICKRFPPGRERRAWLTWAVTACAHLASAAQP
jgi:hypothetical protein